MRITIWNREHSIKLHTNRRIVPFFRSFDGACYIKKIFGFRLFEIVSVLLNNKTNSYFSLNRSRRKKQQREIWITKQTIAIVFPFILNSMHSSS